MIVKEGKQASAPQRRRGGAACERGKNARRTKKHKAAAGGGYCVPKRPVASSSPEKNSTEATEETARSVEHSNESTQSKEDREKGKGKNPTDVASKIAQPLTAHHLPRAHSHGRKIPQPVAAQVRRHNGRGNLRCHISTASRRPAGRDGAEGEGE